MFEYAVKFVCGRMRRGALAPGRYYTAINIHNPFRDDVKFQTKAALAGPDKVHGGKIGVGGFVSEFEVYRLEHDQALEIECMDISRRTASFVPRDFISGFYVIQSDTELDVVAVYTTQARFWGAKSIDVETISARVI